MPNVALLTDQGEPLILPAQAVTAILTLEGQPPIPNHVEAKSIIYSSFRGFSVSFLAQSAREVWDEVKSRLPAGAPEMTLFQGRGEDAVCLHENVITGLEGLREGDQRLLRLTFMRNDGENVFADVQRTEELVERLTKMLLDREDAPALSLVPPSTGAVDIPKRARGNR